MKTLLALLALLVAFLRPGIDEDTQDGGEDTQEGNGGEDTAGGGNQLDLLSGDDSAESEDAGNGEDALEAERAARKAADERATRAERESEELRRSQGANRRDPIMDEEERKLSDPKTSELEKWQIQSNRAIRANRSEAQTALAQAQDLSDRTAFSALAMKSPELAPIIKKYETRVEEELVKMRKAGQNAPREGILRFLLGNDMLSGKFKKAAKAAPSGAPANKKTPGARSDVRGGGGGMTEHEKREKRLENVHI